MGQKGEQTRGSTDNCDSEMNVWHDRLLGVQLSSLSQWKIYARMEQKGNPSQQQRIERKQLQLTRQTMNGSLDVCSCGLPIVVMTVTEYSKASLNDQLWPSMEDAAASTPALPPAADDGSTSSLLFPSRPLVAATMVSSNLRNCSCTSIVQLRSYNTLRRSAEGQSKEEF